MGYSPPGKYLWDPWIGLVDGAYHMFYLQAERYATPEQQTASVGHAVSDDLDRWRHTIARLWQGGPGDWDSAGLRAASFYRDGPQNCLLYTGIGVDGRLSVGLATSDDMLEWRKTGKPELVAGNQYTRDGWRDPYVFTDPADGQQYAVLVASQDEGTSCLALAQLDGGVWEPVAPLAVPQFPGDIESPQLIHANGRWYAFFTAFDRLAPQHAQCRVFCYTAASIQEPFRPVDGGGCVLSTNWIRGVRLVPRIGDQSQFVAIGWLDADMQGRFVGALSAPLPVELNGDRVIIHNVQ